MSGVRLAYNLGEYVQQLRERIAELERTLRENDPWPENLHPGRDWHAGRKRSLLEVLDELEALVDGASS